MIQPLIRVVDFETSSLDDDAAVCEIGHCDVMHVDGSWTVGQSTSELVHPGRFIQPTTSAIHHITDVMVQDCPPAEERLRALSLSDVDVWCAHFMRFDRTFFNPEGSQWICTYKCAVRRWPDAPSHSNQVLRYFLGLPIPVTAGLPHRAKLDSLTTAHLLAKLLETLTVEQLLAISSVPALLPRCRLGEHRGKLWPQVPRGFLEWILKRPAGSFDEDVIFTVRHWLMKDVDTVEERAPPPISAADHLKPQGA